MASSGKHLTRRSASVLSLTARKFCKTLTFFLMVRLILWLLSMTSVPTMRGSSAKNLCHGSLRDLYYHGGAPVGFLLVVSTGGGIF